jgi:F-type H+-transporting ATPase subunit b
MVTLDSSIIPAIIIFLSLVVALNYLLFRPLMRVQAERESRTTGVMAESRGKLDQHASIIESYQTAIRDGRLEAYRKQEQVRAEAMNRRAEALDKARKNAEHMIQQSRAQIQEQVENAKIQLAAEARELGSGIAAAVLRRTA